MSERVCVTDKNLIAGIMRYGAEDDIEECYGEIRQLFDYDGSTYAVVYDLFPAGYMTVEERCDWAEHHITAVYRLDGDD